MAFPLPCTVVVLVVVVLVVVVLVVSVSQRYGVFEVGKY